MNESARIANRQGWIERLDRFKRSNVTIAQFCRDEGVSVPSFYQWRKKLSANSNALLPAQTRFLPVELAANSNATSSAQAVSSVARPDTFLSLDLPGGVRVRLEVCTDPGQTS